MIIDSLEEWVTMLEKVKMSALSLSTNITSLDLNKSAKSINLFAMQLYSNTKELCVTRMNSFARGMLKLGEDMQGRFKQVHVHGENLLWYMPAVSVLVMAMLILLMMCVALKFTYRRRGLKKSRPVRDPSATTTAAGPNVLSVFDMAKTCYEIRHQDELIKLVETLHYDVNFPLPSNGLTLFLCACLSGQKRIINYLLKKGANVQLTSKDGDSPLYLATFGLLNSPVPDLTVLFDLVDAGCSINAQNSRGYTALHRAASKGSLVLIKTLLTLGADPYIATKSGVYPIDSAINAGHLEAAKLLKIKIKNPHVWEIIEPHTPPNIRLGLQSPIRSHLIKTARPCQTVPNFLRRKRLMNFAEP